MSQTETVLKACQALLWGQSTQYSKQAGGKGLYCPEHGREYASLTQTYKEPSAKTERLYPGRLEQKYVYRMGRAVVAEAIATHEKFVLYVCRCGNTSADNTAYEGFQRN